MAVLANDGYFLVVEPTTFAFYIAKVEKSVCRQQFLAALVTMQNVNIYSGSISPFKLLMAMRTLEFVFVSH